MHQISFKSAYYFGDLVAYQSYHTGPRQGRVIDITLSDDGSVSYVIQNDDGTANAGIYPDEMQLIAKSTSTPQ